LYSGAAALATPFEAGEFRDFQRISGLLDRRLTDVNSGPPGVDDKQALERLTQYVEANRDALDLMDRAAPLEFLTFAPGTDYNYRTSQLLDVFRAADVRTRLAILGGDGDRAAADLWSELRLTRTMRTGNLIASIFEFDGLGSRARRVGLLLERAHPSAEWLARLATSLEQWDNGQRLDRDVALYRASYIEFVWPRYFGRPAPVGGVGPTDADPWGPSLGYVVLRPWVRHALSSELQRFAVLSTTARDPRQLLRMGGLQLHVIPARTPGLSWLVRPRFLPEVIYVDVYPNLAQSFLEALTVSRAARIAIAIEQYRRAHDRLPTSPDELRQAGVSLPLDPMNDAALQYRVEPGGFVVYGVGPNGKDDGGAVEPPPPPKGQVTRTAKSAPDWGVRVRTPKRGS
jgi:hypothetical protein